MRELSLDRTSPDISGLSNQEFSEGISVISNQELPVEALLVSEKKESTKKLETMNHAKVHIFLMINDCFPVYTLTSNKLKC